MYVPVHALPTSLRFRIPSARKVPPTPTVSDPLAPATVVVTHHIEEIPTGSTHALILQDGKIAISGPINEVITSEHISAVFGANIRVSRDGDRFYARSL